MGNKEIFESINVLIKNIKEAILKLDTEDDLEQINYLQNIITKLEQFSFYFGSSIRDLK